MLGIRPWDWDKITEAEGMALMTYIDRRNSSDGDD